MQTLLPGSRFPDCELIDHSGNRRMLSDLVAGDPAVLQFYRGWWCPKEQAFFRRMVAFQDEVEVAYARVISVSVDPPDVSAAFRAGLGARWTFLSDADRSVQAPARTPRDDRHRPRSLCPGRVHAVPGPDDPSRLQRLLVLGTADAGRAADRHAVDHSGDPDRLGGADGMTLVLA